MTAYLAAVHLLNLFAPALGLAALMATASKVLLRQALRRSSWGALFVRIAVVDMAISLGWVLVSRHDGSMAQYAALVVGSALAVWSRTLGGGAKG